MTDRGADEFVTSFSKPVPVIRLVPDCIRVWDFGTNSAPCIAITPASERYWPTRVSGQTTHADIVVCFPRQSRVQARRPRCGSS